MGQGEFWEGTLLRNISRTKHPTLSSRRGDAQVEGGAVDSVAGHGNKASRAGGTGHVRSGRVWDDRGGIELRE